MLNVNARAPTRVDIGGGTLDIYPLSQLLETKLTVNFAIDLFAEVDITLVDGQTFTIESTDQNIRVQGGYSQVSRLEALPLVSAMIRAFWSKRSPAFSLRTKAKSPAGAGLGGSSSLGVALLGAIMELNYRLGTRNDRLDDRAFIQCVQDVETEVIKVPTGCQDYWSALLGGISVISFPPGGPHLTSLRNINPDVLHEDLVLCFSGKTRASGLNNWAIFKGAFDGDHRLLEGLNNIGAISSCIAESVSVGDWPRAWAYSREEWKLRKQLWPEIASLQTDLLENVGCENGAILSRVCGAGGGGVVMFIAERGKKDRLCESLQNAGGEILDGSYIDEGLIITVK